MNALHLHAMPMPLAQIATVDIAALVMLVSPVMEYPARMSMNVPEITAVMLTLPVPTMQEATAALVTMVSLVMEITAKN